MTRPFNLEQLPADLQPEILTDYTRPTMVLRGETRTYRQIIKDGGGKYWAKDRSDRDDPRWTVTGDRAIRRVLKALATPDPAKLAASAAADQAIAEQRSLRDELVRIVGSNSIATYKPSFRFALGNQYSYQAAEIKNGVRIVRRHSRYSGTGSMQALRVTMHGDKVGTVALAADEDVSSLEASLTQLAADQVVDQAVAVQAAEHAKATRIAREAEYVSECGRSPRGGRLILTYTGQYTPERGSVYHSQKHGWLLVLSSGSDYVSEGDIEDQEDCGNFHGRQNAGYESTVVAVPVESTNEEAAIEAAKAAKADIEHAANTAQALAADDFRYADTDAYRVAMDRAKRLLAGESAIAILS